jgi:hemolysin activation/secretion protein
MYGDEIYLCNKALDPQLSPQQKKLISYTVKDIVVEEAPCFPIKQVTLLDKNNHDNQYQAKDFSCY